MHGSRYWLSSDEPVILARSFSNKGFTLIELMVTIVILLVLSGTSISAYLNFNKTQLIENDARQLVTELNRVRALAASIVYPSGCTTLRGYNLKSVDINGVHSGVVMTAKCLPADIANTANKLLKETYFSMPSSTLDQPFDVTFQPGNGYLSTGQDIVITIRDSTDLSTIKKITVGAYAPAFISQ